MPLDSLLKIYIPYGTAYVSSTYYATPVGIILTVKAYASIYDIGLTPAFLEFLRKSLSDYHINHSYSYGSKPLFYPKSANAA